MRLRNVIPPNLSGGGHNYIKEKEEWRRYCAVNDEIPLYFKDWYWDANCNDSDDWWVILVRDKKEEIIAAFPFQYTKRKGMYFIEAPWQVASAGIWYKVSESSSMAKQLRYIDDIIKRVLKALPRYDCFRITFGSNLWTWQPLHWAGFKATPYYTMVINDILPDKLMESITSSRRNVVRRKGDYRFESNELAPEVIFQFIESCYSQRGKELTYSKERFLKLLYSLREHEAVKIRSLYNGDEMVALNILFSDKIRNYNHFIAHSVQDSSSGSKMIYDSILYTMNESKAFDFEGSMIQDNCRFYSSFNPKWEIKYVIEDFSNRYTIMQSLRTIAIAIKASLASQFGGRKNS